MNRKLKVSIEKVEQIVIRQARRQKTFCHFCLRETEMLSLKETALTLNLSERQIVKLIENGAFHFAETREGFLLICRNSLEAIGDGNR